MKKEHVKITPVGKGYFLSINDPDFPNIENSWAVMESELLELQDKLNKLFSPPRPLNNNL